LLKLKTKENAGKRHLSIQVVRHQGDLDIKDDEIPVNKDKQNSENLKMVFQPPLPLLGENILPGRGFLC
jgi:hypothetical protein